MSSVRLGDTIRYIIETYNLSTLAATNSTATPVVTVREQGTDLGYAPTVTNITTGVYEVAIVCTAGNGFDSGKEYTARVDWAIGGVTRRLRVGEFTIDATAIAVWQARTFDHITASVTGPTFAAQLTSFPNHLIVPPDTAFCFTYYSASSLTAAGATYDVEVFRSGSDTALTEGVDYTVAAVGSGSLAFCVTMLNGLPAGPNALLYFEIDYANGSSIYVQWEIQVLGSGIHGTAVTGTLTTTAFKTSITATVADQFKDTLVRFTTGANKGQIKRIGASTTGANSVFTLKAGYAFTTAPSNGDAFEIVNG